MKIEKTNLEGVIVIEPKVFGDHRGWFMETFSQSAFESAIGKSIVFVQDNHSFSATKGTLRGLHYQLHPSAQSKLVRCTKGSIYDVAVDIRKGSSTYGHYFGVVLSEENKKQLFVPQGFAHGFLTLEENCEVQYKVDALYDPHCDRGIAYNDPTIRIEWPLTGEPVLSDKDLQAPSLEEAEKNFEVDE